MVELNQLYKCSVCGNIVEVTHVGGGNLVCCGKAMNLLVENSVEASIEKHKPIIEETSEGTYIRVGLIPHPMEEKHYIEFIEAFVEGKVFRKYLHAGEKPEMFVSEKKVTIARAYCNLHGLWKN